MQIRVTGRHVEVSDRVRSYAEEKLSRLSRYFDRVSSVEVTFDSVRELQHVKAVVHVEHNQPLVAESNQQDVIVAVDEVARELEHQLKKRKEQVRNDRKHAHESIRDGQDHLS